MVALASVAAALSLFAAGSAAAAAGDPAVTLTVTGRGWGHGIGMSQWGAYGFAQRGATYDQILAHYYRGTELSKLPGARIRVLLLEDVSSALIGSFAPFTVEDGNGERHQLEATSYRLDAKLELDGRALPGPLTLRPGRQHLLINGAPYRGTVQLSVVKGKLRGVNTLGLEPYLQGVVPREVPSSWPVEALKAQAVAARSYALATRKTNGDFDAYADVRSQVYGGVGAEAGPTNAAIRATARQVLRHDGKVATTFFFSTSGGKTVDISEAWPGSKQVPYLVGVDDPYDDASPHHTWGPVAANLKPLLKSLRLRSAPVDAKVRLGPSGRATQLVLTLADGGEAAIPAATVRSELGLRSTWFRIGAVLSLSPPKRQPTPFGTKARLTGFVRGADGVSLERKPAGGAWEQVTDVELAEDGSFAFVFRGERTTHFRLLTAKLKGAPLRVRVAPRVTLKAAGGAVSGVVRPLLPGATVVIQRQNGFRWRKVGTATVDERGAYSAELALEPGVYRARVAPGKGLAPGLSRPLSVSS